MLVPTRESFLDGTTKRQSCWSRLRLKGRYDVDKFDQGLRVIVGDDPRVERGADLGEQLVLGQNPWNVCSKIVPETGFEGAFSGTPYPVCPRNTPVDPRNRVSGHLFDSHRLHQTSAVIASG